jgi:TolA-binding protein
MIEPRRLHEIGTDPFTQQLVQAGRHDLPSQKQLSRLVSGLAGGTAVASTQVSAAGAAGLAVAGGSLAVRATGGSLAAVLKWLGVGALGGVAVSVASSTLYSDAPPGVVEAATIADSVRAPDPRVPGDRAQQASIPSVADSPSPGAAIDAERVAPSRTGARNRGPARVGQEPQARTHEPVLSPEVKAATPPELAGPPPSSASSLLREEVVALARAKAAVDRGSGNEALAELAAYRARFPQGKLAPEAVYLEMEAELSRGNQPRARALAEQLAPIRTPNAKRVRDVLRGETR